MNATHCPRPGPGINPRPVRGHKIEFLVMLFCCLICVSARVERGDSPDMLLKKMGNVILCYADWSQCDEKVLTAAHQGCNVIVWFAINIQLNQSSGSPMVMGGPDPTCVATIAKNLSDAKLETLHLVSIGGWDQPHPTASCPSSEVWEAWKYWNREVVSRPALGFAGYDGIDWDIEGSDTLASRDNTMSVSLLDLMGEVSRMAKNEGYVVSVAALESYLDPTTVAFNRSLIQSYPEWDVLEPNFTYHGRNTLAYLVAKYGQQDEDEESEDQQLQLYETFSHANFAILHQHVSPSLYLAQYVSKLTQGWVVDFSSDDEPAVKQLGLQRVAIAPSQLVLGVANAWAGVGNPVRAMYLTPLQLSEAYQALLLLALPPRGFMFWSLKFEGKSLVNTTEPVYLAAALNDILRVRPPVDWQSAAASLLSMI